jgi:hypothetical protein
MANMTSKATPNAPASCEETPNAEAKAAMPRPTAAAPKKLRHGEGGAAGGAAGAAPGRALAAC